MRTLLALILSITWLSAADLFYARVTAPDGPAIAGWWDPDTRVVYLPGDRYQWVKEPKSVVATAPGQNAQKPAKRAFRRLPDLPYGMVSIGPETYTGWFHEATGKLFPGDPDVAVPFYDAKAARLVELLKAPGPMRPDARDYLDRWAIANAAELDGKKDR